MILSDATILEHLKEGSLIVDPLDDLDLQVQPASIDLRLGEVQSTARYGMRNGVCAAIGVRVHGEVAIMQPGDFTLGCTLERVRIPHDLVAVIDGRSTYGRLGLAVHVTAGYIDPGFEGQITLELANLSDKPITLVRGTRIAQLRLHTLTEPCARPYGHPSRGSKYQSQTGPTAPRLELERGIK